MNDTKTAFDVMSQRRTESTSKTVLTYSLSVIMPAHNEEAVIAETVRHTSEAVAAWTEEN